MTTARTTATVAFGGIVSAVVLVACLFPSLDEFEQQGSGAEGNDGGSTTTRPSKDGSSKTDASGPKDGASISEPEGNDGGGQGLISCSGVSCVAGTSFCCFGADGTTGCINESQRVQCGLFDGEARCDDSNDCGSDEACCEDVFEDAVCMKKNDCHSFTVCRSKAGCPDGKDCTIDRGHGYKACTK